MAGLTVYVTYGTAMYEAAKDENLVSEVKKELYEILDLFKKNPDYYEFLCNPTIEKHEKKEMINNVFQNNILAICCNFLNVLVDKRRMYNYEEIIWEYNKLASKDANVHEGILYSVKPLSEEKIKAFEKDTAELIKEKVRLINKTDESLIGGISIYIDGKLIDASLKSRLKGLSKELLKK